MLRVSPRPPGVAGLAGASRIALLLLIAAVQAPAADWVYFKSGPIEVWTNGDDDPARRVLATFEQVRWWTAKTFGKQELTPLWPVRIIVRKPAGRNQTVPRSPALRLVRDAYTAGLGEKDAIPQGWLLDFVRILIRDDTKAIPAPIEEGIATVLSTLQVEGGTAITLGAPPSAELRSRDFARMHLLAVDPNNQARVRVFLAVLQQGAGFDTAYRNAFDKTEKEGEADVDRYFAAGKYEPQQVSGKPLNPQRDYRARQAAPDRAQVFLADLLEGDAAQAAYRSVIASGSKHPDAFEGAGMYFEAIDNASESAPAWVEAARKSQDKAKSREMLQKAMSLNPRWAAPHAEWANMEIESFRRVAPLKKATELEPRNTQYWILLAEAQQELKDFAGANQSWRSAERSAVDEKTRASIERRRLDYEKRRLDLEAAERKRQEEEKQREIERLKAEAMANIRRAEAKANAGAPARDPNAKVVEWWDGPKPAGSTTGKLERMDCVRGAAKLVVRDAAGKLVQHRVADPTKIAITGAGELTLGCGPQKPARAVKVEFDAQGNVLTLEFQ